VETLAWIIGGGVLMSAIALIGVVTFVLSDAARGRLILPLVAFSAGSLLGGAFFHLLPEALEAGGNSMRTFTWMLLGFALFFALEQFLHWHHWHHAGEGAASPLSLLIIAGDGVHNFLGGMAVAGAFLLDIRLGVTTWLAAAAHEVPQELGKYGVLLHGGWGRGRALMVSFATSLTFLIGGLLTYAASFRVDTEFLVPFAAGNFLYIGASDLIPEVNRHHRVSTSLLHFGSFAAGVALLYFLKVTLDHH
jgi:zinc and cadmium transporter